MMNTELANLATALASAGYPVSVNPARPPQPGTPAVYVGPPDYKFPYSACVGPVQVTVPVAVIAAGSDREQLAALYDALDAVCAAVPFDWSGIDATPEPTTDNVPAYTLTLTKESLL